MKSSILEIKHIIRPRYFYPVLFNKKNVNEHELIKLFSFFILYLLIFSIGVIVILALNEGSSFSTALSASVACLSNVGPGLDQVGPQGNYSNFSEQTKWFLSFLMLVGRLELYTILVLFSKSLWIGKN